MKIITVPIPRAEGLLFFRVLLSNTTGGFMQLLSCMNYLYNCARFLLYQKARYEILSELKETRARKQNASRARRKSETIK